MIRRLLAAATVALGLPAVTHAQQQLTPAQVQSIRQNPANANFNNAVNNAVQQMILEDRRGGGYRIYDIADWRSLKEGFNIWESGVEEATSLPPEAATSRAQLPSMSVEGDADFFNAVQGALNSLSAGGGGSSGTMPLVGGMPGGSITGEPDIVRLRSIMSALPSFAQALADPRFGDTTITAGGRSVTVATLLPIYAGYQESMAAASWTSLDLYPPGPSSVATVPEVPWYSLSSAGTSPPFDWISLSAAGTGLPLDGAAYDAAQAQRVAGSSAALDGALAWLVARTQLLTAAWNEPGNTLVDPEARRIAFARVWASFAAESLGQTGIAADAALSNRLFDLANAANGDLLRATIDLGGLLADSRGIVSTGGLSDIGISGLTLAYLLRDFGTEDGDRVNISLTQFGRTLYSGDLGLLNAGTSFSQQLRRGVGQLTITALNEGSLPPNTAEVQIDNVTRGNATQSYSLNTRESATLRIESDVPAGR